MTKQTECRWGRELCNGRAYLRLHWPWCSVCGAAWPVKDEPLRPVQPRFMHHTDGTPCGGAECDSPPPCPGCGRILRGVHESGRWRVAHRRIQDGAPYSSPFAPMRDTCPKNGCRYQHESHQGAWFDCPERRKAERRQDHETAAIVDAEGVGPEDPERGRRPPPRTGKDRRQPVCSNPECGGAVRFFDGHYQPCVTGDPYLDARGVEEWKPAAAYHMDGSDANPPGQPDGPCKRRRKAMVLMDDAIKEAAEELAREEAKPQSAGLVERLRQYSHAHCDCHLCIAAREAAAEIEALQAWASGKKGVEDYLALQVQCRNAEAQAARYREALEAAHPQLVKLAQEAWPDGDLYLHGSKFRGKTIPAVTLHRLQQSEREVSEALHPEPDHD